MKILPWPNFVAAGNKRQTLKKMFAFASDFPGCEWTFKRLTVSDATSRLTRNGQDHEGWAGHIPTTRGTRGGHAEVKSHSQGHLQPHILDGDNCRVPSSPQRLLCSISVLVHPVSVY